MDAIQIQFILTCFLVFILSWITGFLFRWFVIEDKCDSEACLWPLIATCLATLFFIGSFLHIITSVQ